MHRIAITVVAGAACAALLAACSSSGGGGTPTQRAPAPSTSAQAPASSGPAVGDTSSSAPSTGALSGTWKGQYGGAYSGTFTLNWQESGSKLSGSIHISNPDDTEDIDGTVNGSAISFGTVGSLAVTYSGMVSGGSMSGTYRVGGSSGGPWNASKK